MEKRRRGKRGCLTAVILTVIVLVGVPVGVVAYQSRRTGMSFGDILSRARRSGKTGLEGMADASLPERPRIDFLTPTTIGDPPPDKGDSPLVSHTLAVDLDEDGLEDVIVCDISRNHVAWIRQAPKGEFTEVSIAEDVDAPARVCVVDIDEDGDLDVAVAVLGMLFPSNDRIGSVSLLLNDGEERFERREILTTTARVADIRAGDLDGDGDVDFALAQFGYDDGETRWLENTGDLVFRPHLLQSLSGPINCPIADIDGDGDLDIVTLVSQEWEEIWAFENDGKGGFTPMRLGGSTNEDFGSSSLHLTDLDADGDADILWTNGDAFDYIPPRPRPWHGVQWLENLGDFRFSEPRRIAEFAGVTNIAPADLDGDGDMDLVAVSTFNLWMEPGVMSLVWLENDGDLRFARRNIAGEPTHLLGLDVADFDGDGRPDLVTGGMHSFPPFDRKSRVVLWRNEWPGR